MNYNLETGSNVLDYPHYTKKTENEILIVTTPDRLLQKGDVICAGNQLRHIFGDTKIQEVIEQRSAFGEHKVGAIFQRCAI